MPKNRDAIGTPSVIRGESPAGEVRIDTLSFTLLKSKLEMIVGSVSGWTQTSEEMLFSFQKFLNFVFGAHVFKVGTEIKGGRNFFNHSIQLENKAGFIAFGGNNKVMDFDGETTRVVEERVQVYLPGEGCMQVPDWRRVHDRLKKLDARITRVDPCFDDHEGATNIQQIRAWFTGGLFEGQGRPPKAKFIDDCGSDKGCTFYVGSRENGKQYRGYEKGKQLGDPLSPWIRHEVEIHATDREIPLAILVEPGKFLAGTYNALAWISTIAEKIKTARLKLDIQYLKLRKIMRTQYGKLLNFAYHNITQDFEALFYEFLNPVGFPDRLKWAAAPQPKEVLNHVAAQRHR